MIRTLTLITLLSPLLGSLVAGIGGWRLGCKNTHRIAIALMLLSFIAAVWITVRVLMNNDSYNGALYTWAVVNNYQFNIGILIDHFSAIMMLTVTFVSLVVHIYSIGYMQGDPGYQRFFSYVSFFTFAMLLLVSANNFLQLFIGWEGVGLASYLLIGFWFTSDAAAEGSLKAFIVNRVGDMGFILGIAAVFSYFGTLEYSTIFTQISFGDHPVNSSPITLICILLFIGAMGKSAQVPLHVWLPESMAGPTPISALIHAATMVTAGVYMVARLSPLYQLSPTALSVVMIIGATGALFLGLLAFVENDIKRVIAYSTMSQLGYMMAANGASAYAAGIFHLFNHACFKSLLFLAAGSVIVALHHEQDLRKMGNLRRYLPITYITFLIGALALAAIPPFSGFYSKDAIILAVRHSTLTGANYAYVCLLIGTFVTAYYTFRAFFLTFHGKERIDEHLKGKIKESRWTMLLPLIILAVPAIGLGYVLVQPMLYQFPQLLSPEVLEVPLPQEKPDGLLRALNALWRSPVWLSILGIFVAWFTCVIKPSLRRTFSHRFRWINYILKEKYGFDRFNHTVFVRGTRHLSDFFFYFADLKVIDAFFVDGSGRRVSRLSQWLRGLQSGYLYHYVFIMIIGLLGFLGWLLYSF